MDHFISVSPISDDKQTGYPARMLLNIQQIYDIRPVIGPVPEGVAADADHADEVGSIISTHGHNLRVAESPDVIVGLVNGKAPPKKAVAPVPVPSDVAPKPAAPAQSFADAQRAEFDRQQAAYKAAADVNG